MKKNGEQRIEKLSGVVVVEYNLMLHLVLKWWTGSGHPLNQDIAWTRRRVRIRSETLIHHYPPCVLANLTSRLHWWPVRGSGWLQTVVWFCDFLVLLMALIRDVVGGGQNRDTKLLFGWLGREGTGARNSESEREWKLSPARVETPPNNVVLLATGALGICETSVGVIYFSFYFKLQLVGSRRSD